MKEDLERLFHFLRLDGKKQSQDDHLQYSKQSDCQLNTQVGDVRAVQIGSHIVERKEKQKSSKEEQKQNQQKSFPKNVAHLVCNPFSLLNLLLLSLVFYRVIKLKGLLLKFP